MNIRNDGAGLVFNIVFTKNTFHYFCRFTQTILKKSSVKVRIVLNGCGTSEQNEAYQFAAENDDRVYVALVSADKILTHHESIQLVFEEDNDSDFFCFADSDIFARKEFMPLFAAVEGLPAMICSGDTIWTEVNTIASKKTELWGRFYHDEDGWTFGSSYFCIYDRALLKQIMKKYGVDFRRYAQEEIPDKARRALLDAGHDYCWYDTAKVVNILLVLEGHMIVHIQNPNLVHVGGMSWYVSRHRVEYERKLGEERKKVGKLAFLRKSKIDPRLGLPAGELRLDFSEYAARLLITGVDAGSKSLPRLPKQLAKGEHSAKLNMLRIEIKRMLDRQKL